MTTARSTAFAKRLTSVRTSARRRSRTIGLAAFAAFRLLGAALLVLPPAVDAWSADVERGKALFHECKRCHQVGQGAKHRIGPELNDVFGRAAGWLADFRYSAAMKAAGTGGLVWTEATLDAFLADPTALVPGSRMSFRGMAEAGDRADLLAWLRGFSGSSADLPLAEPTATPEEYGLDPQILTVRGDPEYGAYLAGECTTCHRTDGTDQGIPSITGWPFDDFVIALHAYKRGKRVHPAMQLVAGRLSDEEIAALAAYFGEADNDP